MRLYLVQHAEAKREEEDPNRDLTVKGRADIGKVAKFLESLDLGVSRVFHSGKTRAKTTADILAASLKPPRGVSETDGLAPLDDPEIWAGRMARLAEDAVLVGHLPHLARLTGLLLCGDAEKNAVQFQMGGMVCLGRSDASPWGLEWMLIPGILP
jgi:phosphohistidine phosphatase